MAAVPDKLTWLITGCSSGLGLSLVRIVQAGGHKVIATSRDPSRTPDLVREVEAKGGKWVRLDVDDAGSGAIVEALEKAGERIDVLVNNAGYSIHAPIETMTEDELRAQMETMYFGPLRLIRAVLPHQRRRGFGVVANFSSGAALEGQGSMGGYAGAKAGLDGERGFFFDFSFFLSCVCCVDSVNSWLHSAVRLTNPSFPDFIFPRGPPC